jgi:hypothetical protein
VPKIGFQQCTALIENGTGLRCQQKHYGLGYCRKHYLNFVKNGGSALNRNASPYKGAAPNKKFDWLAECFPEQREFITDLSKRKSLFVARRCGKSYAIGILLLKTALENPNVKCLYFAGTEMSAINIMWKDIIEHICIKLQIPHPYNIKAQEIRFENGSTIKLTGGDASDNNITKVLGGKYALAVWDECQVITHDLEYYVNALVAPAMTDYSGSPGLGTIVLAGTAGDLQGTRYWYKVTGPNRLPGWSIHTWTYKQNTAIPAGGTIPMCKLVENMIADHIKVSGPDIIHTSWFKTQWKNEWQTDTDSRIYKYDTLKCALKDENIIKSLNNIDSKWKYILGVDFGFNDANAIVVAAFSRYDQRCYIVESFKQNNLVMEQIADLIQIWKKKYKPIYIIGDAQNKIVVETLRNVYRIPIVAAKKLGKFAHIQALNSDFVTGKIRVIEEQNIDLIKEWADLTWIAKKRLEEGKYVELASKENHLCDAAIYMHHFSKHYRAEAEPVEDNSFAAQVEKQFKEDNMKASMYDIYEETAAIYGSK